MNDNQPAGQSIKVDLSATENITCDECEGHLYTPVFVIKKLSALLSPTGDERLVPIQTFQCTACGHVNENFSPNGE